MCKPEEMQGAVGRISHIRKACFVQGLQTERIQTIVRSRGESVLLSQAAEISLEEGAILSITEKSRDGGNTTRCTLWNRLGHLASRGVRIGFPCQHAGSHEFYELFRMWASRAPRDRLSTEVEQGILRIEGSRGRMSGNDIRCP